MSNFYHEAGYVCPSCGTGFKICEFTEFSEGVFDPFLFCPKCGSESYRCSFEERFLVQRFVEDRQGVMELRERLDEERCEGCWEE